MEPGTDKAEAFEDAVRAHGGMVARIVSSYEARPALAEELCQDAFAALWQALPGFRGEASLKTFIARIAHNTAVSHVRRSSRIRSEDLPEDLQSEAEGPEEAAQRSLARRKLVEAVRGLPLGLRQVVTLHLEGFSDREVAEALGLTEGNVAVRLTRARAKLKETIGETA